MQLTDPKWDNTRAVMDALAQRPALTRAQLARQCGLCLTTVGKIADRLIDYGLVTQQRAPDGDPGRTPALLRCADTAYMAVFHRMPQQLTMSLFNLRFRAIGQVAHTLYVERDPAEQLRRFLADCRAALAAQRTAPLACGLHAIEPVTYEQRLLGEQLGLTVDVVCRTHETLAHAACYEGIATADNCVLACISGAQSAVMIHHARARHSDLTCLAPLGIVPHDMTQTVPLLHALLAPDTVLLCTEHTDEPHRRALANALNLHTDRPVEVVLRDTQSFPARGLCLMLREQLLTRCARQDRALRT